MSIPSTPTTAGSLATPGSPLETTHGRTTIADSVVTTVAGIAARDVAGVHDFGASAAGRALGSISERITGARTSSSRGVSAEVGERQAAIDLTLVVDYGAPIAQIARAVRANVIRAVEQMTGLEVVEVNINVADLHQPDDDQGARRTGDEAPAGPSRRVE